MSQFVMRPVPRKLDTKEDLVKLDIRTMVKNSKQDILARNIYFLELALVMPFDNPIKALIRITDEEQYQKYKLALTAHINLRLADDYVQYGRLYYKENIYFFNDDYYDEYLDGYDIAEFYFKSALIYRQKAAAYAAEARAIQGMLNPNFDQSFIDLDQQIYYLTDNPNDFERIYARRLDELEANRQKVLALKNAE